MRSPARSILPLLLLITGALVNTPFAQQSGDGDPLMERQRQLKSLKSEIEENRRKIEEIRKKEKNAGAAEQRIKRDRELTIRYLAQLGEQERVLLSDLGDRQIQLDERTTQQEAAAGALRKRLRFYQRRSKPHTAELLLSARSFSEMFARAAFLSRAIQKDRADLIWLRQQREEVAVATALLESRRNGLQTLQEEKLREKARLDKRSAAARDQIESLRRERAASEARTKELEKTEAQIRDLIRRLEQERERARKSGRSTPAGEGLAALRGRLPWPVKGELIGKFGVEINPRFGTKVPSNGIDIQAPTGTAVHAVAAGVVEFVDWYPGYGRSVIIDHGGGYYTLYAHCARVAVSKGARVAAGQTIAEVGDTDSLKGPCLHFEIRRGTEAMNPQEWLP